MPQPVGAGIRHLRRVDKGMLAPVATTFSCQTHRLRSPDIINDAACPRMQSDYSERARVCPVRLRHDSGGISPFDQQAATMIPRPKSARFLYQRRDADWDPDRVCPGDDRSLMPFESFGQYALVTWRAFIRARITTFSLLPRGAACSVASAGFTLLPCVVAHSTTQRRQARNGSESRQ
jgi:hypothetical protein